MKTQIKKIAAAIMLLMASATLNAGTGNTEARVSISSQNGKAVVLQLNNLSSSTEVSIKNEQGTLLFQDVAEAASYSKVFQFKGLKAGALYLEIENNEQLEVLTIEVTNAKAHLRESSRLLIEKPILKMKGDKAKVFFGQGAGGTKVALANEDGEVISRYRNKKGGAKTFDFSNMESGSYQFRFKTGGRIFYETVEIKSGKRREVGL